MTSDPRDRLEALAAAEGLAVAPQWADEVTSTQDAVRAWVLSGRPHGSSLLADRQTAGRGRLGRTWVHDPGAALALSVLLRPTLRPDRLPLLSLGAAVALREVLGPSFRIKWPNDVLGPDERKVAGILAEAEISDGRVLAVILGIGVNLLAAPPVPGAGCVADHGGPTDREVVAVRLVGALLRWATVAERQPGELLDGWRAGAHTLGRRVRVGGHEGTAEDIDSDGALRLRSDSGGLLRVLAGDVEMVAIR